MARIVAAVDGMPVSRAVLPMRRLSGLPQEVIGRVLAGPDAQLGVLDGHLDCVLAPRDGSEASAHAVAESVRLFCAHGVDVVVLHVFEALSRAAVPVLLVPLGGPGRGGGDRG